MVQEEQTVQKKNWKRAGENSNFFLDTPEKLLKFTFISFLNTFRSSKQERKEALLRRMVPSSRSVVVSIRKTGAPVSHLFLFRNLLMSLKGQHRFNYMWLDHRKISRAFGFVQNSIRLKRAVEPRSRTRAGLNCMQRYLGRLVVVVVRKRMMPGQVDGGEDDA